MKSLITGGLGLIGSNLANHLEGEITIITRSIAHKERLKNNTAKIIIKDFRELKKNDLEGIDVIYHFASTVDNYNVLSNPYIDVETNIIGTIRLLEIVKDLGKKPKIVFPSTFFVYGNEYDHIKSPIHEESKTDPLALYPATKLCTESVIKLYSRLYNIPYLICRLTNVYGEDEEYSNSKKAGLNYLAMKIVKGEPISVYKGGNFYRDYIYVDDVVSALLFLVEKNIVNDTYLVGFGESIIFKTLITYMHNLTGNKSKISETDPPPFHKVVGIGNFAANISKLKNLGWKAKIDYKTGLERIIIKYKNLCEKGAA